MIPIHGVRIPLCQTSFSLPQQSNLTYLTASGEVYNSYARHAITSERKRAKLDFLTEEEKAIRSPGPDFFLPELSTIEVSSEVTIPPPETFETDAHEVDIAPIVSSSSVYDLIYQSFCDSEGASDVILSPSSTSDESLDDILQCLEADGYCSDALESTMPLSPRNVPS
ncbi:hypothetical protein SprV_0100225300 [Sparganum proliferum]